MITEYHVGDRLYEGTHGSDGLRRWPIVREWEVIAVTVDPRWNNTDSTALFVITMRADVERRGAKDPSYRAISAEMVDIDVKHGTWRRTKREAEALIATWAGYRGKPKKGDDRR